MKASLKLKTSQKALHNLLQQSFVLLLVLYSSHVKSYLRVIQSVLQFGHSIKIKKPVQSILSKCRGRDREKWKNRETDFKFKFWWNLFPLEWFLPRQTQRSWLCGEGEVTFGSNVHLVMTRSNTTELSHAVVYLKITFNVLFLIIASKNFWKRFFFFFLVKCSTCLVRFCH